MEINFDELSNLSTNRNLSIPYEEYFSNMDLTKEQIEKRIKFSEDFEDIMLFIFALLFVMRKYNYINEEYVISTLQQRYLEIVSKHITIDGYVREYIDKFAKEVIKTTQKHPDDDWYLSNDRGILISENEANTVFGHNEYKKAIKQGKTKKTWITEKDSRVRKSHAEVDNVTIPIKEPFVVGGDLMLYPKDETYSPSAEQTANCRCTVKYY